MNQVQQDPQVLFRQWRQGLPESALPVSFQRKCPKILTKGPKKGQPCQKACYLHQMMCQRHLAYQADYQPTEVEILAFTIRPYPYASFGFINLSLISQNVPFEDNLQWQDNTLTISKQIVFTHQFIYQAIDNLIKNFNFRIVNKLVSFYYMDYNNIGYDYDSDPDAEPEPEPKFQISDLSRFFMTQILGKYIYQNDIQTCFGYQTGRGLDFLGLATLREAIGNGLSSIHPDYQLYDFQEIKEIPIAKIQIPDTPHFQQCCQEDWYPGYDGIACAVEDANPDGQYRLIDGYHLLASIQNRGQETVSVIILKSK